jgi:hypothetical protein
LAQKPLVILRGMKQLLLTLCLVLASSAVQAHKIYKVIRPDGTVEFTDVPPPDEPAQQIEVPPLNTIEPLAPSATEKAAAPKGYYDRLTIDKPESGQTVRDNQGNVEVVLTLDPQINSDEGHKIQILYDGQEHGDPSSSLEQTLEGVARGGHTVGAQVIDKQGRVLIRSQPVSFQMMRASPLFHPPRADAPPGGVQQAPRAPMAPRAPRAPHAPFHPAVPPPPPPPPTPAPS